MLELTVIRVVPIRAHSDHLGTRILPLILALKLVSGLAICTLNIRRMATIHKESGCD